MNSDANIMSSSGNELEESKKYLFGSSTIINNNNEPLSSSQLLNASFTVYNSDKSLSPHFTGFTNAIATSDNRTIPALPNLTAPSQSTSWSNSSLPGPNGIYSLFSSFSSSSLIDKNTQSNVHANTNQTGTSHSQSNQNPFPFVLGQSNAKPSQTQNRNSHYIHPSNNKSYHVNAALHPNMDMHPHMQPMQQRSSDPLETVLGPFPCVRIRGLPFNANLEDVLVFFQGLVVLDVVVLPQSYNQHGPGGEAFVVFGNPMDFQMALQRNRLSIGHQYVEVYQGKRADYYAAVSLVSQQYNPHRVDEAGKGEDNQELHQGNVWTASGVHHATPSQVLRTPLMQDMGNNNTNNNPVKPHGLTHQHHTGYNKGGSVSSGGRGSDGIRPKGAGRGSGRGGGIQVGEHTGYLRMRGLPFTVTKGEIFEFFKKFEPIFDSVCLTYRSDGRATGEGYIAFQKPDDAKDAMALHRNTMGSRYIELFISNKDEHGRALAREASVLR